MIKPVRVCSGPLASLYSSKQDIFYLARRVGLLVLEKKMPFVSTKNNGGVPDPNVNRRGRPLKGDEKTLTRREAKDKEHLTTARKFKPLKHSALKHLKAMLDDPKTSEAAKVKIIDMILKHDMNLLESLYAPSRGDEMTETEKVEDVQPQHKPAFSLHMLPPTDTAE